MNRHGNRAGCWYTGTVADALESYVPGCVDCVGGAGADGEADIASYDARRAGSDKTRHASFWIVQSVATALWVVIVAWVAVH